jgi:hypothetical protein
MPFRVTRMLWTAQHQAVNLFVATGGGLKASPESE